MSIEINGWELCIGRSTSLNEEGDVVFRHFSYHYNKNPRKYTSKFYLVILNFGIWIYKNK